MMNQRRSAAWFAAVFVLVVLLVAGEAAISVYRFDGPYVVAYYFAYLVGVGCAIGVFVWAIDRWYGKWFVPIISFLITFLIFSLRFNFFGSVLELTRLWYAALFCLIWALTAFLLSIGLRPDRVPFPFFATSAVIVLSIPIVFSLGNIFKDLMGREAASVSALSFGHNLPVGWEKLVFREKPNIYLISFDSLIPADVASEYLKIKEPDYYRLVPDLLRELPRSVMFRVPSFDALTSVMRLDQSSVPHSRELFTGGKGSPLSEIARQNSYRLVTGWPGHVEAWRRGPHVDRVVVPRLKTPVQNSFLCEMGGDWGGKVYIRGAFFCAATQVGSAASSSVATEELPYRETMLESALDVASNGRPSIFFAYVYNPLGHTPHDFNSRSADDHESYRDYFVVKSREASAFISRSIVSIRARDPSAIIVIFGDHGVWLSRTANPQDDPRFFFSDRHRVFVAVAEGGHRCSAPPAVFAHGEYNTVARLLLDVFLCLSGGDVVIPVDFDEDPQLVSHLFQ